MRDAVARGVDCTMLIKNYRKDGTLFWNSLRVAPLRDTSGTVTHFVGIQAGVTEVKRYEAELEHRADYDALTGLPDKTARRPPGARDRVCTAGEAQTRNTLLRYVAAQGYQGQYGSCERRHLAQRDGRAPKESLRLSDTVARITGDEFVVVLNDVAARCSGNELDMLAKLRHDVHVPRAEYVRASPQNLHVTPSSVTVAAIMRASVRVRITAKRVKDGRNMQCCWKAASAILDNEPRGQLQDVNQAWPTILFRRFLLISSPTRCERSGREDHPR